jgi:hypothetical protein
MTGRRDATMSVYIDAGSRIVHDQEQSLALVCPHCLLTAHITPSAVPSFEDLQAHKPKHVGLVYRCDACLAPVFLRFTARLYGSNRVELAPQFAEVERPRETYTFTHLPEEVELFFREALVCYSSGAFNAFASMCRRTSQAVFADLGETGKLRLYGELNNVRMLAELDADTFVAIKHVLFGSDADPRPNAPLLDSYAAGILLEVMKDLLYEAYVRKGKLQQAMMVRRFFVDEKVQNPVLGSSGTNPLR